MLPRVRDVDQIITAFTLCQTPNTTGLSAVEYVGAGRGHNQRYHPIRLPLIPQAGVRVARVQAVADGDHFVNDAGKVGGDFHSDRLRAGVVAVGTAHGSRVGTGLGYGVGGVSAELRGASFHASNANRLDAAEFSSL